MAVTNTLTKKKSEGQLVTYESNGEKIQLSPAIIKSYLVSGGGNVTDQEVGMFLSMCKFQHLNPFLREAYLIKFGTKAAQMVVGKDVFLKRAQRNPKFKGFQAGIIVSTEIGEVVEREGTFKMSGDTLIGGWARVYVDGNTVPFYSAVSMDEYVGRKGDGSVNAQWNGKPATMIRKVALSQALREAFPDEMGSLYAPEEMGILEPLPEEPVQIETDTQGQVISAPVQNTVPAAKAVPETVPETVPEVAPPFPVDDDIDGILFG